jgi:hypothetical protein
MIANLQKTELLQIEAALLRALRQAPSHGNIKLCITLMDHTPQRYTIEVTESVLLSANSNSQGGMAMDDL